MTLKPPFGARAGVPVQLRDDLALVLAPNPSPMTGPGTNTFLLGQEALAIIDPGPDSPAHFDALRQAIGDRPVTHIFVTHSHLDHSPLAKPLADLTGAKVLAFGDSQAGRRPIMQQLAAAGELGGGEGIDHSFCPDVNLDDLAIVQADWGRLTCLHTPGHMANHISLLWKDVVFCGDHVMDWSTSLISPPDGDLTAFMTSCEKLRRYGGPTFYPAHGGAIADPVKRLDWLIAHRKSREAQVQEALSNGLETSGQIVEAVYTDLPQALFRAAQSNIMAHLLDLLERRIVLVNGTITRDAKFALRARK